MIYTSIDTSPNVCIGKPYLLKVLCREPACMVYCRGASGYASYKFIYSIGLISGRFFRLSVSARKKKEYVRHMPICIRVYSKLSFACTLFNWWYFLPFWQWVLHSVNTVVSRASAHSRVSAHVPNFKGSLLQLQYKHMEFISRVSAHTGQNLELCLSAHGRLPGTLRYIIQFTIVLR